MRQQLAGIHHAEIAFAVHDLAHKRLASQTDCFQSLGRGRLPAGGFDGIGNRFHHRLVAAINQRAFQRNGFAVEGARSFSRSSPCLNGATR